MDAPIVHILLDKDRIPRTIHKRVKVKMMVQMYLVGSQSIEAIAEHCNIDLADVYAALAYYYDNQTQMDAEFERDKALLKATGVSGSELKQSIQQRLNDLNTI